MKTTTKQQAVEAVERYKEATELVNGTETLTYQIVQLLGAEDIETRPADFSEAIVAVLAALARPDIMRQIAAWTGEAKIFAIVDFLERAHAFCDLFTDDDVYSAWAQLAALNNISKGIDYGYIKTLYDSKYDGIRAMYPEKFNA